MRNRTFRPYYILTDRARSLRVCGIRHGAKAHNINPMRQCVSCFGVPLWTPSISVSLSLCDVVDGL